jgi:hypothetical protein
MRAKQLQILNFSFAYLCLRSATPFPFRTTRFLSGDAQAPCSLQIVRQVLSNTRFHDYACVYFGSCLSRQQARCVGGIVISGSVDVTFTSCGYWYSRNRRVAACV